MSTRRGGRTGGARRGGRGGARGGARGGRSNRGRGGRGEDAGDGEPRQGRRDYAPQSIVVTFSRLTPQELRETKESCLNIVAAALIQQPRASVDDPIMRKIIVLVKKIAFYDPEFVLKLALYVRIDLNIRSTTNFLLAIGSNIKECQPYFKKYFGETIRLPSDWIDVAATYQQLPDKQLRGQAIPTCLRKAMVSKFPDFDAYQLGKYNKERSIKRKIKKQKEEKAANPDAKFDTKPMLTLKQLIRQLHISQPSLNVMCLLGKKYPLSESSFKELGLPGAYEEDRAGRRMKLPTPETWETLLSEKGNKASTWEELIEHKKLPFMAMLRNLRNLIYSGVHPRYHKWAQNKLCNATTIAQSKQFPFRFFSAYEVIPRDLEHFKQLISGDADKKKEKAPKPVKEGEKDTTIRRKKKKQILPTHMPNQKTFDDYRNALDQAVKHATTHNVQPIKGSTVVFCNVSRETKSSAPGAKGMGASVRNIQEVGYLLGLMCKYVCEDCDFQVYSSPSSTYPDGHVSVDLKDGTILDNMKLVADTAANLGEEGQFPYDYLENMIREKRRVDNLLVLSHQVLNPGQGQNQLANLLNKYRSEVHPDMLFVSVDLSGSGKTTIGSDEKNPLDIMITGFSDQILRFIAERGDQNQLQYVEHIDEAKNLNKKDQRPEVYEASPWWRWLDTLGHEDELPTYPNIVSGQAWRSVRVFISSTFLDMHGERDILTRIVFPELKERAKQRRINIYEVDLRWGVTEEESQSGKSIELCLAEVERCRPFFIGILGDRYGWAPETYEVPDTPQFHWLTNYPRGRSVTELEMQLAALSNPNAATGSFFYFRDNQFLQDVPETYIRSFQDDDPNSQHKMADLKNRIRNTGVLPIYEYPCTYGGLTDGKPVTAQLDSFAERVFFDLWTAIDRLYPKEDPPEDPIELERLYHQSFVENTTSLFTGRKDMTEQLQKHVDGLRSQLLVVSGKAGEGKSALLAQFAKELAAKDNRTFVLAHFIGASPGSTDIRKTLTRLCAELKQVYNLTDDIPSDFKELCITFPKLLEEATFKGKIVIIIDAVNQLDEKINRAHSMEWLPAKLPCKFIISTTEGNCVDSLKHRFGLQFNELKMVPLIVRERSDLVRDTLWQYHKKLDERPMNNQMRVLLRKAEAGNPLYLVVACEELRVFGVYERIADRIKSLGEKIPKLFDEVLYRLETDHGKQLVQDTCSFICVSRNGLLDIELRSLVTIDDYKWSGFLRALSAFIKAAGDSGELTFFHQQFHAAVLKRYLNNPKIIIKYHARLSEFFQHRADPSRDANWKGGNDVRAIRELPHHLIQAEKWDDLVQVLTDLVFIELKISLGQMYDLLEDYNVATGDKTGPNGTYPDKNLIREYKHFLLANANILQNNSALTFQQAANQPGYTEPAKRAQVRWNEHWERRPWIQWINKPEESDACKQTYSGFQDGITACTYSRDGRIIAIASRDCLIRTFNAQTGTEILTLAGHSNWIVTLQFSPDGAQLVSASWDETFRLWDVDAGRLIQTYQGHDRRINSCAFSHDGTILATASWDCTVKLWNIKSGDNHPSRTIITGTRPVNDVAFSSDDKKVIAATWEGKLKEFNTETGELLSTFSGHSKSVQRVAYEPSGNHLVSGGFDNKVILWDAHSSKPIATLATQNQMITSVAYTADGAQLLATSADATARVWQSNLGRQSKLVTIKDSFMNCCSYHPTIPDRLVAGSSDCMVIIWDLSEGKELSRFEGNTRPITAIEYSPDGSCIASGAEDGVIIIWNSDDGSRLHTFTFHTACITSLCWSPTSDGRLASSSDDYSIRIWDTINGKEAMKPLTGHTNAVKSVSFDNQGKLLASAARDNTLRIWDSRNGNQLNSLRGHLDWLNCCHFSPNGKRIVTCSWDFSLALWNVKKGTVISSMKGHQSSVSYCRFSPDGKTIVSASFDGTLKIWDAESASEITTLSGHSARVNCFCFSPDGINIASVSDDSTIKVWDPLAATELSTLIGHSSGIRDGCFSPVTKQIITASDDRTLKIWDVGLVKEEASSSFGSADNEVELKEKVSGHQSMVNDVKLSSDSARLATASDDGTFALWDVATLKKLRHIQIREKVKVKAVQFSPSVNILATASDDGIIDIWDPRTREKIGEVTTHTGPATCLAFSSDDYTIISGGWDCQIHITDYRHPERKEMVSGAEDWIQAVAISPDRKYICSSGWDTVIRLYSTSPTTEKAPLLGHTKMVSALSFSYDSRLVASSSYDSCVKLWNLTTGKLDRTFAGHSGKVNAVAFASKQDGIVLSAGSDHRVILWDVSTGNLRNEFICQAPVTSVAVQRSARDLLMVFGDTIGNIDIAKFVTK